MGIKLNREKKRNWLVTIFYKLDQIFFFISPTAKLRIYLDLSFIFSRFAHEYVYKTGLQEKYLNAEDDFLVKKIRRDARVIDLGCGSGYVAKKLLVKTNNILGVDFSRDAIERATRELGRSGAKFVCDDIFDHLTAHPDESYDVVILSHVIEHIDDAEKFLKKISDKAEYFYIEVPDFEANHFNIYRGLLKTDLVYTDGDHVYEYDRGDMLSLIRSAGLKVIDTEFIHGFMKFWCRRAAA